LRKEEKKGGAASISRGKEKERATLNLFASEGGGLRQGL